MIPKNRMVIRVLPPLDEETLKRNIEVVCGNVRAAAERSGRRYEDITLLAATKMQSVQTINRAIACGISCIGENKVQELTEKYDDYDKMQLSVHFIGRLQTNKVKYIANKVDMIQSVDSIKLAAEIDRQCAKAGRVLPVLVEVNIGGEDSKGGVEIANLSQVLVDISQFRNIKVSGLMSIPPLCTNDKQLCIFFSNLNKEFLDISAKKIDNVNMQYLSMGMSGDYVQAIECGANMIRVGTGIFGLRKV